MKSKNYIIALSILLLVFSTSTVWASENSSKTHHTENHICSSQDTAPEKKSSCDNDHIGDKGCGGSCSSKYCHFSSSVSIPFYIEDAEQANLTYKYVLKIDHTCVQNTPKKISLSIWQPPEIS
ncbi:hypothetical protein [Gelidibacter salicanalis]|uniref:Secreted protein n=1 Tax=Gelidibacter salicanalis TaxID=291193 RepID=A0A934NK42_9FLAO|nr:hypothetical protein [Gelidibacter salicanalis]MBJ7882614.1 hypothetical protein [Gelidibacter salicanalis]